ncbi:phospholipase D-like domain-containing protein [Mycoplasma sp. 1012]
MKKKISINKVINFLFLFSFLFFLIFFTYVAITKIFKDAKLEFIIGGIIFYFINCLFAIYLFLQERHIDAKISWILIILIFPFFGPILFLIFGRKYNYRIKEKDYLLNRNLTPYDNDFCGFNCKQNVNLDLFDKAHKIFTTNPKNFNSSLYLNGYDFFEKLFLDLKNAKKFIFIELYIIKNDFMWLQMKNILIQKAKENVEIKIILDWFGSASLPKKDFKELKKLGIQFYVYNKIWFPFIHSKSFYRIHKKLFIIDGKIGYIGGNNLSDEYSNFSTKYGIWFDANLRIKGQIVVDLTNSFIKDWNLWTDYEITDINSYLNINFNMNNDFKENYGLIFEGGPRYDVSFLETFIIQMIYSSKEKIEIFTPYFIPTRRIFLALKEMIILGRKVEIYLPGKYDKKYVEWFTKDFAKQLEEYGAQIFEFKNIFSHTKSMIIDENIAYTGTMNLDIRSFYSQYEINVLIQGQFIKKFNENIKNLKEKNIVIPKTFTNTKPTSKVKKMIIELFKSLL